MKSIIMFICAISVFVIFAKTTNDRVIPESVMRKTGGIVEKKGLGKIVVINCQSKISVNKIKERVGRLSRLLKYNFEVRSGEWNICESIPTDANLAIFIVDKADLPLSLVAVESGWGMMNTAEINNDISFSKQLTRVFALTAGAMCSRNKHSPMQPITQAKQIETLLSDNIMRDMIDSIRQNLASRGIEMSKISSYVKACQEGWAPAPTNEYQKAIWDKIHAMPTAPIKIKPETKKVKE